MSRILSLTAAEAETQWDSVRQDFGEADTLTPRFRSPSQRPLKKQIPIRNAAKIAQAGRIVINLRKQDDAWLLTVKDDGVGLRTDAAPTGGMDLRILQYRARIIHGTLTVTNNDDGGLLVPCMAPEAQLET